MSATVTMLSRRLIHRASHLKVLSRFSSSSANPVTPIPTSPSPVANQAPNYPTTWTTSQISRAVAQSGPRFEQTVLELQPNPLSAMEMVNNEPIRVVHGRKAVCDGGGGPLGHPKIFINLDKPGARPCGYCGLRFEQAPHDH
ncbi:ubiquinone oxidoreductase 20 kd subunit [Suillus discolor]|uniref:Ubiquinone oxidoreductase 20 kd subunit n=1 Tax=Suillus discolor TaxID=1912936 RepID=A0A9P7K193_9AGAM|nr:ubiquinone oxidoreductase 20 kd subunit [Suillus discolor]KAG2120889.1 ubiquinone oxidoreductase 20 kd subunit [Suillus discolor]